MNRSLDKIREVLIGCFVLLLIVGVALGGAILFQRTGYFVFENFQSIDKFF
jgi:hypothetical protein